MNISEMQDGIDAAFRKFNAEVMMVLADFVASNIRQTPMLSKGLTNKERAIMHLILENYDISNKEIAGKQNIAERTVKWHITNILRKEGCQTRAQLVQKFIK